MEYHLTNKSLNHWYTWQRDGILKTLSWAKETQKSAYSMIPVELIQSGRKQISVCRDQRRKNWVEEDRRKFYGAIEMLYIFMEIVVKQVYSFVNTQQIVHFIAHKLFWRKKKYDYFWAMELKIIFILSLFFSAYLNYLHCRCKNVFETSAQILSPLKALLDASVGINCPLF